MKFILCALDLSDASLGVTKKAIELADGRKVRLTFLFSYRLVQPLGSTLAEYRNTIERKARQDFDAFMSKIKIKSSVSYEFRPEIGFLSDRIDAFIANHDVELLVIGQELVDTINKHKGFSLEQHIDPDRIPLVIVPPEWVKS